MRNSLSTALEDSKNSSENQYLNIRGNARAFVFLKNHKFLQHVRNKKLRKS